MILKNKRVIIFIFCLSIIGVLDTLILLTFTNIDVGIIFPGVVGLLFIIYLFIRYYIKRGQSIISNRILNKIFVTAAILAVFSFIAVQTMLVCSGNSQEDIDTKYLIILGTGIKGETISLTLKERLEKGIEYLSEHPGSIVVVSGGQGRGESISEAEAMKRYLVSRGIDSKRILKEDRSTSTMENFKFSKVVLYKLDAKNSEKIVIITNDFHMFRAKMLARRNGFVPFGISSQTPISVRLNCYIREYFALIKSLGLDR